MEERLDPFYYIPSLVELEKKVQSKKAIPLRKFIRRMASGATPSKNEEEKFYTTKENNGIPFVRVQNLTETSELLQNDLRYINSFTHNIYLKRSQVKQGDLLTKITGVGRMAVSTVVPIGFVGNINQHIVVSKTENAEASEVLAAYLNSDVGEKLASRRSTGGTRPALDYPALRSIPIVYKPEIVDILKKGIKQKQQKEQQAENLLNSIDDYLLQELGIQLPTPPPNTITNRMFTSSWQKVAGNRFDALYHQGSIYNGVEKTKYKFQLLKQHILYLQSGFAAGRNDQDDDKKGFIQIRPTNISENRNFIFDKTIHIDPLSINNYRQELVMTEEVLFNNTNSQELVGKTVYFNLAGDYFCSNHITRIKTAETLHPLFLTYVFNLYQRKKVFYKYCINWNNQSGVNNEFLKRLHVPVPDIKYQEQIIEKLEVIKQNANRLLHEAQHQFNQTKKEIEQMILE